jgi:hypothetical protein
MGTDRVTAPWSPSRAREAARAALCRLLTAPSDPRALRLIRILREALEQDTAFDTERAFAGLTKRWRSARRVG